MSILTHVHRDHRPIRDGLYDQELTQILRQNPTLAHGYIVQRTPPSPPPAGVVCGPRVAFYTGSYCSTQAQYNAGVDAYGRYLFNCSPLRGVVGTVALQSNKSPDKGLNGGLGGNVWGGWSLDDGTLGGWEVAGNISGGPRQIIIGGGKQYPVGGSSSSYNLEGASIGPLYFQYGKAGYLEIGIGKDKGYANFSGGLLFDYNKLLTPWWNLDENACPCPSSTPKRSAPPAQKPSSPPPLPQLPPPFTLPPIPSFGPGWFGAPHN